MTTKTDEEFMQEAMQLLSQEPSAEIEPSPPANHAVDSAAAEVLAQAVPSAPLAPAAPPSTESPTLAALAPSRHPKEKTVCETCPNSVWFSSPKEVKCYCRVMFLVTWSSQAPHQLTHCDGLYLGQDE